jgi:integrase
VSVVAYDPLRDSRHRDAASAREQADWLAWLELGGTAPRTLEDYEWATALAMRMFPLKSLAEFTDGDLLHVFKKFPAGSRRVRVAAYRSWFKWAVRTRRITQNPLDLLPEIKRQPQKRIDVFDEEEIEALTGEDSSLQLVDRVLMLILFDGGLRKGEARRLLRRDCSLRRGELDVVGKGQKPRSIPMSLQLQKAIVEFDEQEAGGPLYVAEPRFITAHMRSHMWYGVRANERSRRLLRDKPIGEGTFHRWWRGCLDWVGVRYRNPHVARHTFATRWRQRGLDLDEIQLLLGHASIRTTSDLYVHTELGDVARKMAALLEES